MDIVKAELREKQKGRSKVDWGFPILLYSQYPKRAAGFIGTYRNPYMCRAITVRAHCVIAPRPATHRCHYPIIDLWCPEEG